MQRKRMQRLRKQETYREKELQKQRENYAENNENILSRKRKNYSRNPDAKRKQTRQHYQNNKEKLRKKARDKARDKARALRYDSEANMSKYKKSIEFGPEFVCVCCHGGFFEEQVWVLTEKRVEKIGPDLMKDSCEMDEIKENWFEISIYELFCH